MNFLFPTSIPSFNSVGLNKNGNEFSAALKHEIYG
jgi:hypothetical protein